ncbi:MAG: S9 family peptidase [Bacteroidetes bacterium]|jgi:dipeptidyl aminopeptidase/acylaminoacyl peptidase|nr:S9 family peptidase [Bacteroidota bacterium]MBT3750712.1 S9 family peptidase [Bacteroidota bacterium]MBT4401485.1 S9 family peptidase [Bacteroidota bacterium]MBT4411175.1 S9 family peptidase [Bacteroidota bacterium]MBT5426933.1 S9 family peptidase [Bacteroidota bacterium]
MKKSLFILLMFFPAICLAQVSNEDLQKQINQVLNKFESLNHRLDKVEKQIDDLMWIQKLEGIAIIDKIYQYGPPLAHEANPTAQGFGNPVKFWSYVFIPRQIDLGKKHPLIVLPHGGVHSDFSTYYTHIVRELVAQGYVVVAAEYRGSTGYGAGHYRKIDYGGLEVDDVDASRQYMIDNYSFIDKNRVGIMGWSHGGLITLMNIFDRPEHYKVAFAGVPVSDLIARMGYKDQNYRDLYEADFHIGKSAEENVNEYRRRSPAWNVHKMKDTPLLIHTNTNDADVNVLEVEHLIKSLKAEGKKFKYTIFKDVPGGHSFDRMDTSIAKKIRLDIYAHMGQQLKPGKILKSIEDIDAAAYR